VNISFIFLSSFVAAVGVCDYLFLMDSVSLLDYLF
jgi:hypothetical protein